MKWYREGVWVVEVVRLQGCTIAKMSFWTETRVFECVGMDSYASRELMHDEPGLCANILLQ